MLLAESEELLTKLSNQIGKEHIDLLMKCYVNQPFICVNNIIRRSNCQNTYSQPINPC